MKVTPDGHVKVLDFGLAKAFASEPAPADPADSPTLSAAPTLQGTILGTAAYMSPEQACGKAVDRRTDIWAFGCVLYELLTGKQAFRGNGATEILATVLKDEPDWQALPAGIPQGIRVLLRRCLQKDPKQRMRDAADLRLEIEEARSGPSPTPAPVAPVRVWRSRAPILVLVALIVAAVTALIVWRLKPAAPVTGASMAHFVISLPPGQQLADPTFPVMALSPDGTRLAYVARIGNALPQIYIRSLDSPDAKPLPGTEGAATPFFSPDGQWLGFFVQGKLAKISVNGGIPATMSGGNTSVEPDGATWGVGDTIVFGSFLGDLQRVSAAGGTPQPLRDTLDTQRGRIAARWPTFLPGAREVLFAAGEAGGTWLNPQLGIYRLSTGERWDLLQGGTFPRYAPTGHLLYVQNGTLMAAPFDSERLEVTGASLPVVEGVMQLRSGAGQYSLSDSGTSAPAYQRTCSGSQRMGVGSRNG